MDLFRHHQLYYDCSDIVLEYLLNLSPPQHLSMPYVSTICLLASILYAQPSQHYLALHRHQRHPQCHFPTFVLLLSSTTLWSFSSIRKLCRVNAAVMTMTARRTSSAAHSIGRFNI